MKFHDAKVKIKYIYIESLFLWNLLLDIATKIINKYTKDSSEWIWGLCQ